MNRVWESKHWIEVLCAVVSSFQFWKGNLPAKMKWWHKRYYCCHDCILPIHPIGSYASESCPILKNYWGNVNLELKRNELIWNAYDRANEFKFENLFDMAIVTGSFLSWRMPRKAGAVPLREHLEVSARSQPSFGANKMTRAFNDRLPVIAPLEDWTSFGFFNANTWISIWCAARTKIFTWKYFFT